MLLRIGVDGVVFDECILGSFPLSVYTATKHRLRDCMLVWLCHCTGVFVMGDFGMFGCVCCSVSDGVGTGF